MNKTLLFTHESDIDGIGCVILGKLAFKEIDYVLCHNVEELEHKFRDYIEGSKLNNYDKIYVTDLALYDPSLTMVEQSSLKEKVKVFDHHQRAIESKMNRYSFTKIIEEDDNKKRCATDLFYEYLTENNYLEKTKSLDLFVEMTRLEDVWQWKTDKEIGIQAHDLAILFNIIGKEKYIEIIINKLTTSKNDFKYSDTEKDLIKNKKEEYNKIIKEIIDNGEYLIDELGNKFLIVFSKYEYRNEIPEYFRNKNESHIKYVIITALDKGEYGQKSYRSIEENFDVNKLAMLHGGGGHIGAAAVNITKDQRQKIENLEKSEALNFLAFSKYE